MGDLWNSVILDGSYRLSLVGRLITSHRAVCDGFLGQALEKTKRAQPFVDQVKRLRAILDSATDIDSLVAMPAVLIDLIAAAGFSDKAVSDLTADELAKALRLWLGLVCASHPNDWRDVVVFCYLLTRGDSLGGSMRNWTGEMAGRRLVAAIQAALQERSIEWEQVVSAKDKIQQVRW